jgi:hypothetical protein
MIAASLVAASAAVIFALGTLHLAYMFHGTKLRPRDAALPAQMTHSALVLTRQTNVWKAWIGFNASHSLGALLFGVVYADLALAHPAVLWGSPVLLVSGGTMLGALAWLGKRYWFSVPFRGIVLALGLYAAGVALALT